MNINDQRKQASIEGKSDLLISEIVRSFPPVRPDKLSDVVFNRESVDGAQMIEFFDGRSWLDLGQEELSIPQEELVVNLSSIGFYCYLPQFMVSCLRVRQYGWIDDMLLPVGFGMDDVIEYFTMNDESLLDPSGFLYQVNHARVAYLKEKFNKEQLACVASYVELAMTHGYWDLLDDYREPEEKVLTEIQEEEKQFQHFLKKYVRFWREC